MINTRSLDQIQKTGDLNANLILRRRKLDKVAQILWKSILTTLS